MATDVTLNSSGAEIEDFVRLRARQDVELCSSMLNSILVRFQLTENDFAASWESVSVKLIQEACDMAVHSPAHEHVVVLRIALEHAVMCAHVQAVVRTAVAIEKKDGLKSVDIVGGVAMVNGVPGDSVNVSNNPIIDRMIEDMRQNPRRMGFIDYLRKKQ